MKSSSPLKSHSVSRQLNTSLKAPMNIRSMWAHKLGTVRVAPTSRTSIIAVSVTLTVKILENVLFRASLSSLCFAISLTP